jgi:uncharacterized protein
MRFRRDAPLDTGQVTGLRGCRMGGAGGAAIGGGLGLVGLVIWLPISLLSNGGGALGQLAPLDQQTVGQSAAAASHEGTRAASPPSATGSPARSRRRP